MSWIQVCLDTTHEAVDWVNTLLSTVDYQGDIQITKYDDTDSQLCDADSIDRNPEQSPWQFTVRLLVPNTAAAGVQIDAIESLFSPLHRTGMATLPEITLLSEKPASSPPSQSPVHRVGQHFVVVGTDSVDRPQAPDIPLQLATNRAFGSGLHPTTVLSLQLLERHVLPGMHALDFGSGSGILSVAMAKLGATGLALDNDRVAVTATQDTIHRNGVAAQVTAAQGSLGAGSELGHWMGGELHDPVSAIEMPTRFNLIAANILARIHLALVDDFANALHRPGLLIAAGFTTDYEDEISTAAIKAGFEAIDREQCNEWVALAYRLTAVHQ